MFACRTLHLNLNKENLSNYEGYLSEHLELNSSQKIEIPFTKSTSGTRKYTRFLSVHMLKSIKIYLNANTQFLYCKTLGPTFHSLCESIRYQ